MCDVFTLMGVSKYIVNLLFPDQWAYLTKIGNDVTPGKHSSGVVIFVLPSMQKWIVSSPLPWWVFPNCDSKMCRRLWRHTQQHHSPGWQRGTSFLWRSLYTIIKVSCLRCFVVVSRLLNGRLAHSCFVMTSKPYTIHINRQKYYLCVKCV